MSRLSYQALESLWTSAGGSQALAPVMAAIAIAESGGDPSSLNNTPSTGDYSVGLWQINYFGGLYGPRSQAFGPPSALLASPTAQARAAVAVYHSQGLSAWSTYTSGVYRQYLNGANYSGTGTAQDATYGTPTASTSSNCVLSPGLGICLLTRGQARALLGGLLLVAGGITAATGIVILAAYGLKRSGALDEAAAAAALIPGPGQPVARVMASSAERVRRQPETRSAHRERRRQEMETAERRRRAGEKKEKEKGKTDES